MTHPSSDNRRPLASRNHKWLARTAAWLAAQPFPTPNQVSCLSVVFALIGAGLLYYQPSTMGLLLCAIMIQMRLLCNLFDGMIAVEGGKKTPNGAIYNEFPDRIADSALLIAMGYATAWPWLGWLSALLAALTAYIRVFGGSLGLPQLFIGPMAKQQRMAVMILGCLGAAIEHTLWDKTYALHATLILIAIGSAYTCLTRTRAISQQLNHQEATHEGSARQVD